MKEKLQNTISKAVLPASALALLLLVWHLVCKFTEVPKYMLPSPSDVAEAFVKDRELMLDHACVTLEETFIGLFLGIAVGFIMAVVMDRFSFIRRMISPLIIVSQTIPTIAIAPLLVIWLGYEMLPKIILIILVVFFPITISLLEGFSSVDADTVNLMRSMGANRRQIFRYVKFPNSLGQFFSSLKISVSYAVVSAVVSEWIGGTVGPGCYMTRVRKSFSSDKMFAGIILISVISLVLIWLTSVLQRVCMPWEKINNNRSKQK